MGSPGGNDAALQLQIDSLTTQLSQCQTEKVTLNDQYANCVASQAGNVALINSLQVQVNSLTAENNRISGLLNQYATPFPTNIVWNPYGNTSAAAIQWAKDAIASTGFSNILVLGHIKEIRVVDDVAAHVPNCPAGVNYQASLVNVGTANDSQFIIYTLPQGWLPGWEMPGCVIHESVHGWQMANGLTAGNVELSAYMVQQVFEWRYCAMNNKTPRNLFKEKLGAIGLL
jgi:hypothetical protein